MSPPTDDPWIVFRSTWERRLRPMSEVMGEVLKDADLKLEQRQAPPMWANDPAHTRRTAFGPTKRVK